MSKIVTLKHDKTKVTDLLSRIMRDLAFSRITPAQRDATMAHLAALARDPRDIEVRCTLQASETGQTIITINVTPTNLIKV